MNLKVDKLLSVFLLLVTFHSIVVGLGLILLPSSIFQYLGFNPTFDRFFSTQGGVFHIAMSFCYGLAAINTKKFEYLIVFTIIVKFIATIFLTAYYFLITDNLIIILSGVTDFLTAFIVIMLYKKLRRFNYFNRTS